MSQDDSLISCLNLINVDRPLSEDEIKLITDKLISSFLDHGFNEAA